MRKARNRSSKGFGNKITFLSPSHLGDQDGSVCFFTFSNKFWKRSDGSVVSERGASGGITTL